MANNLAFYYAEHDPTEENLDKAEKLIKKMPKKIQDSPQVLDTLAWIQYRKGNFEEARDAMSDIGDKAKEISVLSYHFGMIYYKLGEKEKARDYLDSAVKSKEPFPGREKAEEVLKGL